jgi:hypothetical protein
LKKKTQSLVDLNIGDKFEVVGLDTIGKVLNTSDFGCLVMLENAKGFDKEGNPTVKKERTVIAAETQVRRLNE